MTQPTNDTSPRPGAPPGETREDIGKLALSAGGQYRVQFAALRSARWGGLLRVSVVAPEVEPVMLVIGPGRVNALLRAIDAAAARVWPDWRSPLRHDGREGATRMSQDASADVAEAETAARAPGRQDGVYAPGQPWRRGRWVAPLERSTP